jgi:hypothetical protein
MHDYKDGVITGFRSWVLIKIGSCELGKCAIYTGLPANNRWPTRNLGELQLEGRWTAGAQRCQTTTHALGLRQSHPANLLASTRRLLLGLHSEARMGQRVRWLRSRPGQYLAEREN